MLFRCLCSSLPYNPEPFFDEWPLRPQGAMIRMEKTGQHQNPLKSIKVTANPNPYGCQPKNKGTQKWMVKIRENPYEQMDDLGGNTPIFGNIHIVPHAGLNSLNPGLTGMFYPQNGFVGAGTI